VDPATQNKKEEPVAIVRCLCICAAFIAFTCSRQANRKAAQSIKAQRDVDKKPPPTHGVLKVMESSTHKQYTDPAKQRARKAINAKGWNYKTWCNRSSSTENRRSNGWKEPTEVIHSNLPLGAGAPPARDQVMLDDTIIV